MDATQLKTLNSLAQTLESDCLPTAGPRLNPKIDVYITNPISPRQCSHIRIWTDGFRHKSRLYLAPIANYPWYQNQTPLGK
jgi:hypothetical protein